MPQSPLSTVTQVKGRMFSPFHGEHRVGEIFELLLFARWSMLVRFRALALAEQNLKEGIMLAPGNVFRPHLEPTPFLRFNVAICQEPQSLRRLERIARGK